MEVIRRRSVLLGSAIEAAPEVPAGNRGVRLPGGGDPLHFRGFGQLVKSPGAFHCGADTEVGDRQHVGAAESEHQKHLSGPDADAFDAGQVLDYGGVVEVRKDFKDDGAFPGVFSQFADIESLLGGKAETAHAFGTQPHHSRRRQGFLSGGGVQPGEDNRRDPAAELLVNDGANQGFEGRLTILHDERAGAFDDSRHDGVFFEMLKSSTH